ncbi:hypothetical protein [Fibrella arboris]|uniref:hypothetical protein n=1 Tax=Fibrella arboris TaxID=3242486 RepID=UPI00351FD72D
MKKIGISLFGGFVGYVLVAVFGFFLLIRLSSDTHDREVEAAITRLLTLGPIGAIQGIFMGYQWAKRSA